MTKAITITEKFEEVYKILVDESETELADFIRERIEAYKKKLSSKSMTATQKANEELGKDILAYMVENADKRFLVKDVIAQVEKCNGLTTQKVSPILNKLVAKGMVNRIEDKGNTYFTAIKDEEDE